MFIRFIIKQIRLLYSNLERGGAWLGIGRLVFILSSFATNILVARILSPSDVGLIISIQGLGTIAGLVGSVEAGQAATRHIGRIPATYAGQTSSIARAAFSLAAAGGLTVGLIVAGGLMILQMAIGHAKLPALALPVLGLLAICTALRSTVSKCLIAVGKLRLAATFDGMIGATITAAAFLISTSVSSKISIDEAFVIIGAGSLIEAIIGFYVILSTFNTSNRKHAIRYMPILGLSGLPLVVSSALSQVSAQSPTWFMVAHGVADQAAVFAMTARVALLVNVLMLVNSQVAIPQIVEFISRRDFVGLSAFSKRQSITVLTVTSAVAIPIMILSKYILVTLFGSIYAAGWPVLVMILLALTVEAASGPSQSILTLSGRGKTVMAISIAGTIFTIMGCIVLLPHWPLMGAGVTVAVTTVIRALAYFCFSQAALKREIAFKRSKASP